MTLKTRMTLQAAIVLGALLVMTAPGYAADRVTYYEDVAPIMQANCQVCHQPSGKNIGSLVAPMSLMTYEETRPWARAIARKVQAREMPPWFASEPKGVFANERSLSDQQIQTILAWVDAGAPAGDKAHATPPPVTVEAQTGGWSLGKPDFVVKLPKPFFVPDDAQDLQVTFYTKLTDELLPKDVNVRAWEFRTGSAVPGRYTVHHMCGGLEAPGFNENEAEENGEAVGLSLGCFAGGAEPAQLPQGYGLDIKKGSTVTMSMHYYKDGGPGTGYWNEAEVGFYLSQGPVQHKVLSRAIGSQRFEIPPHARNYRIGAAITLKKDTELILLWPHAHLRAVTARYVATYPDGRKELLLDVPRYDQSWQVTYKYKEPKLLPKGTRIDVDMTYDNTADRAAKRGFDTNKTILQGPRTQDEMMLGFFSYTELEAANTH